MGRVASTRSWSPHRSRWCPSPGLGAPSPTGGIDRYAGEGQGAAWLSQSCCRRAPGRIAALREVCLTALLRCGISAHAEGMFGILGWFRW